tara:strand:+ start:3538 stop:4089 length:552 start_codon:yes stop_codon:yes gene_type:complete
MSFAKACEHIDNYTAGHETRSHICGEGRLKYPDSHIESDNRLSWFLGRLDDAYGDNALYVHLVRDPNKVARSYASRARVKGLIMEAYKNGIYLNAQGSGYLPFAKDYVHTVNKNIDFFLKSKTKKIVFDLDLDPKGQFKDFWELIGAEGNIQPALAEFDITHNAQKSNNIYTRIKRKMKTFFN